MSDTNPLNTERNVLIFSSYLTENAVCFDQEDQSAIAVRANDGLL